MEADFGFFGNMIFNWLMANPMVVAVLASIVAVAVVGFGVAKFMKSIGVAMIPVAKWTKTEKDDKFLAKFIYWADAVGDVLEKFSVAQWKKGIAVISRIREDSGLPYKDRRRE